LYNTPRYGAGVPRERLLRSWYTSNKVNGKLDKTPQTFVETFDKLEAFAQYSKESWSYVTPSFEEGLVATTSEDYVRTTNSAYNKAYFKFWNMLRGDNTAGLAINLFQWRQTWKMIGRTQDRLYSIMNDAAVESRRRARNGSALQGERFADLFLEKQFGWAPLFADTWAVVQEMAGFGTTPVDHRDRWFSAHASAFSQPPDRVVDPYKRYLDRAVQARVTIAAKARVNNPNLWLANRMGLVNPAAVAWDAVPWSFLVGMFSNLSGCIASFSNDLGVILSNGNVTYSTKNSGTSWMSNTYPASHPFYAEGQAHGYRRTKQRVLTQGVIPRPSVQFFLPKLEWSNALIGASLIYQQVRNRGSNATRHPRWGL
jgi:hypothetical protein